MAGDTRRGSDEIVTALVQCEEQVDHLKRENKLLRDASRTFGALAERLNATLESERRAGRDRRAAPRGQSDRRQTVGVGDSTRQ
ncbi:MAG TPA: hypothetical protein VE379_02750 [Vicinamibacterales bacterium]|jgi:hypothetical protein|nr:hypothetical protein [Vicinamibacterales bacterium]